jgi:hypothetical protein
MPEEKQQSNMSNKLIWCAAVNWVSNDVVVSRVGQLCVTIHSLG